jgi:hypothetical protein
VCSCWDDATIRGGVSLDGYRSSSIDELPTLWDGFAKLVRARLGIDAFKSHDEAQSGSRSSMSPCVAPVRSSSATSDFRSMPTTSSAWTPARRAS